MLGLRNHAKLVVLIDLKPRYASNFCYVVEDVSLINRNSWYGAFTSTPVYALRVSSLIYDCNRLLHNVRRFPFEARLHDSTSDCTRDQIIDFGLNKWLIEAVWTSQGGNQTRCWLLLLFFDYLTSVCEIEAFNFSSPVLLLVCSLLLSRCLDHYIIRFGFAYRS